MFTLSFDGVANSESYRTRGLAFAAGSRAFHDHDLVPEVHATDSGATYRYEQDSRGYVWKLQD